MKKENLYITGYELSGENSFKKDLDEASGVEWTFVGLKSNHARKGALTEIRRYFYISISQLVYYCTLNTQRISLQFNNFTIDSR